MCVLTIVKLNAGDYKNGESLVEPFATITSGDQLLSNRAISKEILFLTGIRFSVGGCRLDISLDLVTSLLETHARQSTGKGKLALFTFGRSEEKVEPSRIALKYSPPSRSSRLSCFKCSWNNNLTKNPIRQHCLKTYQNHQPIKTR